MLERGDRVVGKPVVGLVERLLAGQDLHPRDLPLAAVGFLNGGIEDADAGAPDVRAGAVAFDERNDRAIGDAELAPADRDGLSVGGRGEVLEGRHGGESSCGCWKTSVS